MVVGVTDAQLLEPGDSLVFDFLVTGADLIDFTGCTSGCGWYLQTKVFVGLTGDAALGSISADSMPNTVIPEPGSMLLLTTGLVGLAARRRRRKS